MSNPRTTKTNRIFLENELRDLALEMIEDARDMDDCGWVHTRDGLAEDMAQRMAVVAFEQIESIVRERFYWIINGTGICIPRIAAKAAIDEIFGGKK